MMILKDKIRALIVEPDKEPYEVNLENGLKPRQKIVGGLIEYCYLLDDDSIAIICNDEGKILGLPYNREIGYDVICGNFIIVGDNGSGVDLSLTDVLDSEGQLVKVVAWYDNEMGYSYQMVRCVKYFMSLDDYL